MDPFTFGIVFTGAIGGVATILAVLEQTDFPINANMVRIFMEVTKFGGILWLLHELNKVFF